MPRRGFSLIELLVVIATIALLIGLLLPGLSAARRHARAIKCLSNVRQLELAHQGYLNDHRECFIDVGLGHGGVSTPQLAWPVALADYYGHGTPVVRSPADRSPYWPVSQGGQSTGLTFDQVLERLASGQTVMQSEMARWTSYGLNSFTTRFAQPSVRDPVNGKWLGPWDRLNLIPRPYATVHFLMMTQGTDGDPGGFARSDHVHPEDWGLLGPASAPAAAAAQCDIAAHGGRPATIEGQACYGFLDGHAGVFKFRDVYTSLYENKFFPDFAQ
jgi:prepilin-type N-terminal cleavage/methylation domain-containing protein